MLTLLAVGIVIALLWLFGWILNRGADSSSARAASRFDWRQDLKSQAAWYLFLGALSVILTLGSWAYRALTR